MTKTDLTNIQKYLNTAFPAFKYSPEKDNIFFMILIDEFPHLDLLEEIKSFHAWCLDRGKKGKPMNYRYVLRKWMKNASTKI